MNQTSVPKLQSTRSVSVINTKTACNVSENSQYLVNYTKPG